MCHMLTTKKDTHTQEYHTGPSDTYIRTQTIHGAKMISCLRLRAADPSCALHDILILSSHSCSISPPCPPPPPSLSLSLHVSTFSALGRWAAQTHIILTPVQTDTHTHTKLGLSTAAPHPSACLYSLSELQDSRAVVRNTPDGYSTFDRHTHGCQLLRQRI